MFAFLFADIGGIVVFIPFVFFVIFVGVSIALASAKSKQQDDNQPHTQGTSSTQYKSEYLERLKRQQAERKATQATSHDDDHTHIGKAEHYEKIVGSLGEVNDEGCDELDGVRLVSDDDAYAVTEQIAEYDKVVEAMVIGEALNHPRWKGRYKR